MEGWGRVARTNCACAQGKGIPMRWATWHNLSPRISKRCGAVSSMLVRLVNVRTVVIVFISMRGAQAADLSAMPGWVGGRSAVFFRDVCISPAHPASKNHAYKVKMCCSGCKDACCIGSRLGPHTWVTVCLWLDAWLKAPCPEAGPRIH
eukprot:356312-Chlamydomonas_euryale.AAC.1